MASLFYDCEVGPAGYTAPIGRAEGELERKRQFKIRGGVMEYALESKDNLQDDVLQRELSHTTDEKMKSIIATIQKEQNQIIRNEKAGTLLIHGVAGSGKTSIALHRIAYLLYRPYHEHTLEELRRLYSQCQYVKLNTSYRSTYEIIRFAKGIQRVKAWRRWPDTGRSPA